MSRAKRIKDLQEWKDRDKKDSRKWYNRARESYRFYTAIQQWLQADIDKLEGEGRPHLTIPLITAIVNTVVGYQIDNEQQFMLYPKRGGTAAIAALGKELLKHTVDECNGVDHMTESFQDGCIGGVGLIAIEDRADYINRQLLLRKKSPFRVILDQDAIEYDFDESGRRQFEEVWLTKEQIELAFRKNVDKIDQATESPEVQEDRIETDEYRESSTETREKKDLYCVTKSYWRRWEKQVYLVNLENFSKQVLHGTRMIQLAKNAMEVVERKSRDSGFLPRMKIIERAGWKLYKTWFVGEMELLHKEMPFGNISDFPIKPFYPYWADGYPFGIVDGNKDAQRYVNKIFSKELEPNLNWWVKDSNDPKAMNDLRRHGGKSNFVLRKDKFGDAGRFDPPKPFYESDTVVQRLAAFMNMIAGVDPTLRGHQMGGGKESGKALEKRILTGIMVTKIVHKNFNRTLKKVGKFLWDAISQKDEEGNSRYYSVEEIEHIVQESALKQFIKKDHLGRPTIDLSDFYLDLIGQYGVKLSTSPSSQTIRKENQEYLLKVAEVYARLYGMPVIPPQVLVNMSDIAEKDEILEYLKLLQRQPVIPQVQPARRTRTA